MAFALPMIGGMIAGSALTGLASTAMTGLAGLLAPVAAEAAVVGGTAATIGSTAAAAPVAAGVASIAPAWGAGASAIPFIGETAGLWGGLGALPEAAAALTPEAFGAFGAEALGQIPAAAAWPEAAAPALLGAEPAWGATSLAADAIPGYGGALPFEPIGTGTAQPYDFTAATETISGPTQGFPEPIKPGDLTPGQLTQAPPVTSTTDPAALD